MPTRSDIDPAQATAAMDKAQEQARRADSNLMDAQQREEELVEQLNALPDGAVEKEAELMAQHQQAERDLDFAKQEHEEAMDEVGRTQDFWFEEQVDESGEELDGEDIY
ncbi:MAG: hypothetical protein HLX51_01445 [Micrococcaceae bacterium]|nr:hypothetical protein [Micrococcaceae bacterium]